MTTRTRTYLIVALAGGVIATVIMHYAARTTFDIVNLTVSGSCGFPFPTAGYSKTAGEPTTYRYNPLGIVANILLNTIVVFAVLCFVATSSTSGKRADRGPLGR